MCLAACLRAASQADSEALTIVIAHLVLCHNLSLEQLLAT